MKVKTWGVVKFIQGLCVKLWKNQNGALGNSDSWVWAEEGVGTTHQEGLPGKQRPLLEHRGQTHSGFQRGPSQDLPALIIYLKNIIALKGQDGIYGLGISVLRRWKESQRFYGSVIFLKKVFKADNL